MQAPLKASDTNELPAYKPTQADLENLRKTPGEFKLSGDGAFHTVQGEGADAGTPYTFVRLHYCNLQCVWCDSWYTWKQDTSAYYTEPFDMKVEELHNEIRRAQLEKGIDEEHHVYRVVFTGGEPLLQQQEILKFLDQNPRYQTAIETNGTIRPNADLLEMAYLNRIRFNCSPKLANSKNSLTASRKASVLQELAQFPNTVFKFVCKTEADIQEVLDTYGQYVGWNQIYIMPEGVTKEENAEVYEAIMPFIMKKGLRTSGRLQNVMFDGSKRKV